MSSWKSKRVPASWGLEGKGFWLNGKDTKHLERNFWHHLIRCNFTKNQKSVTGRRKPINRREQTRGETIKNFYEFEFLLAPLIGDARFPSETRDDFAKRVPKGFPTGLTELTLKNNPFSHITSSVKASSSSIIGSFDSTGVSEHV